MQADAIERRLARRNAVLADATAAAARWQESPGRNLVLLFDGTGNILGNHADTNVVKLLRVLCKGPAAPGTPEQVVYYDPGVGTNNDFPPEDRVASVFNQLRHLKGLALGDGAFENVAEGYEFLCRNHRDGDRIYLFGFSRGAFTARAIGGMVNMYGLVAPQGLPMMRSLVRMYFARESRERDQFAQEILDQFSLERRPLVHFVGVWDSVETIGLTGRLSITNSRSIEHKRFVHVRHALSMHETRQKYAAREYVPPALTPEEARVRSFEQTWFRGVHSDVGGSYAEAGLSNIALNWMMQEAVAQGLEVRKVGGALPLAPEEPGQAMHDQVLESPYWLLAGLAPRDRQVIVARYHPTTQGEPTSPRRASGTNFGRIIGALLLLATVILGYACARAGAAACDLAGPRWVQYVPSAMQLLSPWAGALGLDCPTERIRAAIFVDWFFLPVYWLWLPYLLAPVLRKWCASCIAGNGLLPRFAGKTHVWLWLLLAADATENVLSWHLPATAWWVAPVTLAKLLLLLVLFTVVVVGLAWRPVRGRAGGLAGAASPALGASPR